MCSTPSNIAVQHIDRTATDVEARWMMLGLVHGFPVCGVRGSRLAVLTNAVPAARLSAMARDLFLIGTTSLVSALPARRSAASLSSHLSGTLLPGLESSALRRCSMCQRCRERWDGLAEHYFREERQEDASNLPSEFTWVPLENRGLGGLATLKTSLASVC